ncbi:MAG: BMC domain-containing protein [Calditrichia bacterium]|nr:BMC domain-containing protein [Calditrichia bacterium]
MRKYSAIALIELSSIAGGILTADAMVKSAPISVLKTGTVHKGKNLILIGGSVASVEEAYNKGLAVSGSNVVDSVILPDIHPQLHDAVLGNRIKCTGEAIGVIETSSIAANIKSTDAGLKEAEVDLVELKIADSIGGKAFTIFSGKLEEVEAAVHAAKEKTTDPKFWLNEIIVPNLHEDIARQINESTRFTKLKLHNIDGGEL